MHLTPILCPSARLSTLTTTGAASSLTPTLASTAAVKVGSPVPRSVEQVDRMERIPKPLG